LTAAEKPVRTRFENTGIDSIRERKK